MNANKKQTKIRRAKSTLKSSRKEKYSIEDLETEKESNISSYDLDYQDDIWEINSNQKAAEISFSQKKNVSVNSSLKGRNNSQLVKSDDLAMKTSNKPIRRVNTSISMSQSSVQIQDESIDLDAESDQESDDDSHLTPEQKQLKDRWLQIFQKISKSRIKTDEAFDFDVEQELQLVLYEWKDSGCILECISKLYSMKVDRLSKEAYHLLACIARGQIGGDKSKEMENEEQEDESKNEGNKQDRNDQKKKIVSFEEKQIQQGSFENFDPFIAGQKQIEKPEKLIVDKYDILFDLDPLFRKKSQYFDDTSSEGLLLNVLEVDKELCINLSELDEALGKQQKLVQRDQKKQTKSNYMKLFTQEEFKNKFSAPVEDQIIDLFPELIDFKMSVIDEVSQQLLFDNIQSLNSENDIKILTQNNKKMEIMDENSASIVNQVLQNENDKILLNEINLAYQMNAFTSQNFMYRNLSDDSLFQNASQSSQNKEDFILSQMSQSYTPDNSIFKNTKQIRFDLNDEYQGFDSSNDYANYHDENPSTQETKQIDNSLLHNSLNKVGGGDKTIFSNFLMNLNWGDPKQWDIQKLSANKRKKIRSKKLQDDLLLGEIKEDMEAEEQNENIAMNNQYERLTKPQKYIDFSLNNGKEESYKEVIGKKFQRYKSNLGLKYVKIKQKSTIQKDYKITSEQVFQIGLKYIENTKQSRIKEFTSEYDSQFDIFQQSQQNQNTSQNAINQNDEYQNEYEAIGFDDLYDEMDDRFYNPQKYNNQRDNRFFNTQREGQSQFDIQMNNSPYGRYQYPFSANNNSQSLYTQNKTQNFFSQTIKRKPVRIRDLKETVWQTMTQQKSKENNSQLTQLSQIVQENQNKRGKRKNKAKLSENEEQEQIESAITQINSEDVSLKFSDLMHQLPNSLGQDNQAQGVSVQNCFISILHLANEKHLRLVDPSHTELEFFIFLDQTLQENENSQNLRRSKIQES
ncbi:condensin complex subunit 2 (macronuclear) [Tetrahymena thermophila SB210]|uniref:Condensin complex subunit 2 n=1 Tax=Tetrahymena thermophila (strain SB210) TaxID=312017 RepID=I7M723_TETTS|nr:condensin complex subunit 2 [Tetrahymena thermophila SB210]EAR87714.2 condensin complex subunit 2 [Tetrahymena thermophila SB210]|eukprot:XP_001007959.2 condensin complex subunit 2 [Tetrahymena thermophila SB210]